MIHRFRMRASAIFFVARGVTSVYRFALNVSHAHSTILCLTKIKNTAKRKNQSKSSRSFTCCLIPSKTQRPWLFMPIYRIFSSISTIKSGTGAFWKGCSTLLVLLLKNNGKSSRQMPFRINLTHYGL